MADHFGVLRRRFPGLVFWYGARTGRWWALVYAASGWRLVEARDAEELTRAVVEADTWPSRLPCLQWSAKPPPADQPPPETHC
jgi:hypothetical protein